MLYEIENSLMRYTFILTKDNRKSRRVGFLVIEPKEQEDNNAEYLIYNIRTNLVTLNVFFKFSPFFHIRIKAKGKGKENNPNQVRE